MNVIATLLLFIPLEVAGLVMSLVAMVFCWLIALFVDKDGNLPKYLRWFQTPDATCFDEMWVAEHPTWSKYKIALTWIARNPAYGFRKWVGIKVSPIAKTYGDIEIGDGELGKAGWFLLIDEQGFWNYTYVIDLKNKSCMRGTLGWNLIPIAKGYDSVNSGMLETDFLRFYSFGVTGH